MSHDTPSMLPAHNVQLMNVRSSALTTTIEKAAPTSSPCVCWRLCAYSAVE